MLPSELLQQARDLIADGKAYSLHQALEQAVTKAAKRLRDEAWMYIVGVNPPTFEFPDEALIFMEKAIVLAREEE